MDIVKKLVILFSTLKMAGKVDFFMGETKRVKKNAAN